MHKKSAASKPQDNLKQNFECALVSLREEDAAAIARITPIVQKRRGVEDTKKQAMTLAASALATLWGL